MQFKLAIYPWIYLGRFNGSEWDEQFIEQEHLDVSEEAKLPPEEYQALLQKRNHIEGIPLVSYSSQYGLSCFEGMKAYPQKDGRLKLFRPKLNCLRMASSMNGLRMPAMPEDMLLAGIIETVRRNRNSGFVPSYQTTWEKDIWQHADTVYVRPFSISEPGIGVNLSHNPWIVVICTTVSAYFSLGKNNAVTSKRIRATRNGTGWIKTAANYVTSTLAKAEAIDAGYMECIFLDAATQKNIEEGSSCNFFALFPNNTLVTPTLGDTILPGIVRLTVIELAREMGIKVIEEDLPVERVLDEAEECFVTGTAAGITPLGSLTHNGYEKSFSSLNTDSLANRLLKELKSIQFGAMEDRHGWMVDV